MFNKRGELTLEQLVKIIIGVIVFIALISILTTLTLALFFKEPTKEANDLIRIQQELESLTINSQSITIPIFTDNIEFDFALVSTSQEGCIKDKPCLCYEYNSKRLCEEVKMDKIFIKSKDNEGYKFIPSTSKITNKEIRLEVDHTSKEIKLVTTSTLASTSGSSGSPQTTTNTPNPSSPNIAP